MIVFDIDQTISPTDREYEWTVPFETHKAWIFNISIPTYVLDFLRSRDDIALLSTWGKAAESVSEAFGFKAEIIVMDDDRTGVEGKFKTVSEMDNVAAWIDDHIKPKMAAAMKDKGVLTIKPTRGVISEKELVKLIAHVEK